MPVPMTDIAAYLLAAGLVKPQSLSDDTNVEGAIVDRQGYDSALALVHMAFTTASGASGATNTVLVTVEHGDQSNLSDKADLDTYSYVYTWAADGDNSGLHALPINLESAKRYIRLKFKITKAGTVTDSDMLGAGSLALGGLQVKPDSSHDNDGYSSTTEPSA